MMVKENEDYLTPEERADVERIEKFHRLFNGYYRERMAAFKKAPHDDVLAVLNRNRLYCLVVAMKFCKFLMDQGLIENFLL